MLTNLVWHENSLLHNGTEITSPGLSGPSEQKMPNHLQKMPNRFKKRQTS